jgi:N-acetylglucosaminyldiphosphoundecaprenol N-acetyl-beta-D-mannosaminyltransferase
MADLVLADGMPHVWASRVRGTALPERVAGSDLIWSLTGEAARRARSVFLLGGEPGACEKAAERLREEFPELRIAGTLCPPHGFERDPHWKRRIVRSLQAARPDIVYVGLGFPKQERLISKLRWEFPDAWFLGVGISISFVAGDVRRAPAWMQRTGLEWVHRLAQEPRRLVRRYLVDGIPFLARLIAHSAVARVRAEQVPVRPSAMLPALRNPAAGAAAQTAPEPAREQGVLV